MSSTSSIGWFLKNEDRPYQINHDTDRAIWAIVAREQYPALTARVKKLWGPIDDFIQHQYWSPATITHYPAYSYLKPGHLRSRVDWAVKDLEKLMTPYFAELAEPPLNWRVISREPYFQSFCDLPRWPRLKERPFYFPTADAIQKGYSHWVASLEPTDIRDWDIDQSYHPRANKPRDLKI